MAVEGHPAFALALDRSVRPDSTGVPRWKQRIREELSHRVFFKNTGVKRGGETVWQLDAGVLEGLPERQRRKLQLATAPHLGKSNG